MDDDEFDDDSIELFENLKASSKHHGNSVSKSAHNDFDAIVLPPLKIGRHPYSTNNATFPSDKTPLVSRHSKKRPMSEDSTRRIFGCNDFSWQKPIVDTENEEYSGKPGVTGFLFGFMLEESFVEDEMRIRNEYQEGESTLSIKLALCASLLLSSAASATPVTLVGTIAQTWHLQNQDTSDISVFTSKAAAFAVLGLSVGKFTNGPIGEILGATRVSIVYSLLLSISLIFLALSWNERSSLQACFCVEFSQSVQWPLVIVILASHFSGNHFESGIYATLLSAQFGSLLSIPFTTFLLRYYSWRIVSGLSSVMPLISSLIMFIFIEDSPGKRHNPQNPISAGTIQKFTSNRDRPLSISKAFRAVFSKNILPPIKVVLKSPTFWIVSISHAGDAMVRSSARVLGSYYLATSNGSLSENEASALSVVLLLGTISGMAIAGNLFTSWNSRQRKRLITRLYIVTIFSCYLLSILAIPRVQRIFDETGLIVTFQLVVTFAMGFGTSVQPYIPGLVGASFGHNKGVFAAYSDGIANALSYMVWRIVNGAVSGQSSSIGW
eukprot:CAMPEP_0194256880 /NCGR_PEP_ID=MMETSP0158-20130606/37736_1 /TAXON_ID=33649 /ORGANISM="Thalassionema nitzschioides, Strain L26-B" /LENGTH=551 /DNA_ID=CAMNT_0038995735 /DNA_START=45 /DNA_END=1697 /DNA_ORIENTATION=-